MAQPRLHSPASAEHNTNVEATATLFNKCYIRLAIYAAERVASDTLNESKLREGFTALNRF